MKRVGSSSGACPRALVVIPARLGSTRLPRKMLLCESGRYLFEHTVEGVRRARSVERIVVATDSEEILRAAHEVGVEALLTSDRHQSGTDRVHEAYEQLLTRGEGPFEVVLNVQGDEPEVAGETLDPLIAAFGRGCGTQEVRMATLCTPLQSAEDSIDPSIVKVVLDREGNALYFSRAPIPASAPMNKAPGPSPWLRHIGVYAFRPEALRAFCALERGTLEARESLEQLRWLEAGRSIRVLTVSEGSVGIDTPEHYAQFLARERARRPSGPTPRARSNA